MSWDEADAIARRLAARLDAPLTRWPERPAAGGLLTLDAAALAEAGDELLGTLAALVVSGAPGGGSEALIALRDAVAAHADWTVVVSLFATRLDGDRAEELPLVVAAPVGDERVAALLAAGPHALTLDDAVDAGAVTDDDRPARVCVVSFELAGMTGGGIGTASTALAEALARAGHEVTFLFSGWQERTAAEANERWRDHCARRGLTLEFLREPGVVTVGTPHLVVSAAYEVDRWLRRRAQPFDVVHAPENMGQSAYAQLAKAHGAAHAGTTFVVGTHGPTRWAAEANRVALTREEFHVNDALERIAVERADVLLGPSRYLHDYMRQRGWRLPRRVHVQPYATPAAVRPESFSVPPAVRARSAAGASASTPGEPAGGDDALPRELVFFGRLETRKGVVTLCDALDLLAADASPARFEVTFLGPVAEVLGQAADAYIAQRAARWPWSWRIVSDLDQRGAAELLSRPGVLAVMPSTVDNAPNTVSEAVALAIPIAAGRSGGTGELVAATDRDAHMFGDDSGALLPLPLGEPTAPADPRPLAELLRRRLATVVERPQPPFAPAAVEAAYDRWHRAVARANDAAAAPADADAAASLTVCLLFDGDHGLLSAQLAALDGCDAVVADLRADGVGPVAAAASRGVPVVRPQRA
ncbi:glycosyltransferase, partial [Conexibacter sp. JD483]|uniref:glycosyltransferase n=2 Tax=Conexibacter TaxID=191494 RepID=UPI00286FB001